MKHTYYSHFYLYGFILSFLLFNLPLAKAQDDETIFKWEEQERWTPSPSVGNNTKFGSNVEMGDSLLAIQAYGEKNMSGVVYLFEWKENSWQIAHKVEGKNREKLGYSLSISGSRLAIGTNPQYRISTQYDYYRENIYLYNKTQQGWQEEAIIVPPKAFGDPMNTKSAQGILDQDRLFVFYQLTDANHLFIHQYQDSSWVLADTLASETLATGDYSQMVYSNGLLGIKGKSDILLFEENNDWSESVITHPGALDIATNGNFLAVANADSVTLYTKGATSWEVFSVVSKGSFTEIKDVEIEGDRLIVGGTLKDSFEDRYQYMWDTYEFDGNWNFVSQLVTRLTYDNKDRDLVSALHGEQFVAGLTNHNTAEVFHIEEVSTLPVYSEVYHSAFELGEYENTVYYARFGQDLNGDGNNVVVSSPDDFNGKGAVYVLEQNQGEWTKTQITAPAGSSYATDDNYGLAADIEGNTLAVASIDYNRDLMIYEKSDQAWELVFNDTLSSKGAGSIQAAIDLNEDQLLITNYSNEKQLGAIYQKVNGSWQFETALEVENRLGYYHDVAIEDSVAVFGAYSYSDNKYGLLRVFAKNENGWQHVQDIHPPAGEENKYYGYKVKIQDKQLFVSSFKNTSSPDVALYVYGPVGEQWELKEKVLPPDSYSLAGFGEGIDVLGDRLAISTNHNIYIYKHLQGEWQHQSTIETDNEYDAFHLALLNDGSVIASNFRANEATGYAAHFKYVEKYVGSIYNIQDAYTLYTDQDTFALEALTNSDAAVTYEIDKYDTAFARLEGNVVNILSPGTCEVHVRVPETDTYTNAYKSVKLYIREKEILSAQITQPQEELKAFPVPASDYIQLAIPSLHLPAEMRIYNLEGKLILKKEIDSASTRHNVRQLKPGVYQIVVKSADKVFRRKILKQ